MIEGLNPRELDLTIQILKINRQTVNNEASEVDEVAYQNVRAKELQARLTQGDILSENQNYFEEKKAFLIRRENRDIVAGIHFIDFDSKNYYITNIKRWKSSRNWIIVECEFRDNQHED